jgi:hypothetical protein
MTNDDPNQLALFVPTYLNGLLYEVAKDRIVWNQACYWTSFRANNTI